MVYEDVLIHHLLLERLEFVRRVNLRPELLLVVALLPPLPPEVHVILHVVVD